MMIKILILLIIAFFLWFHWGQAGRGIEKGVCHQHCPGIYRCVDRQLDKPQIANPGITGFPGYSYCVVDYWFSLVRGCHQFDLRGKFP